MKYLGIDFGSKRVGFAESDEEGKMAFPMMIAHNDDSLLRDTLEIIRALNIGCVVIGESLDLKGKPNEIAKKAREFAVALEDKLDIKVVFEKEWFSSAEARKAPEAMNKIDDAAAAIILQRYLDKSNPKVFASEQIVEDDSDE